MSGSSSGRDSDSESGSGSGSESEGGFARKVVFRKRKDVPDVVVRRESGVAEAVIKRNNARLDSERVVGGETALVQHLDDTEKDGDWEEWKVRELERLHRDRKIRLDREIVNT